MNAKAHKLWPVSDEETALLNSFAEADLNDVAKGDFSQLSAPILVAAATLEQFDEFVFSNGLSCSEVRRFRSYHRERTQPAGKILIQLPFYYDDPNTAEAVEQWVNDERWTVHVDEPLPMIMRPAWFWYFVLIVIAIIWIAAAMMFKK
jgi:hypothetical protein